MTVLSIPHPAGSPVTIPEASSEPGLWQVQASDLGWGPGEWPDNVHATLAARGMEPELPVIFERHGLESAPQGDLAAVWYRTVGIGSMYLMVEND